MADAKLNRLRLTDDDDGVDVVEGHAQLEEAIGKILGIDDKVNIRSALLGAVDATGGIFGIRYKDDGVISAEDGSGIEFWDEGSLKKLCFANSVIAIWEYDEDSDTWDLMTDYEVVVEPELIKMTDVNIPVRTADKIVGTTDGDKFVLRDPGAVSDGVDEFTELTDAQEFHNLASDNLQWTKYLVGVKDVNNLGPFPPGEEAVNEHSHGFLRAYGRTLNHVTYAGGVPPGGTWTLIDNWQQADTLSSVYTIYPSTFNGTAKAGIHIEKAGVYRLQLAVTKRSSEVGKFITFKVVNSSDTSSFPNLLHFEPNPFFWQDTPWGYPGSFRNSTLVPQLGEDGYSGPSSKTQTVFLLVRDETDIAIKMGNGLADARAVVDIELALERIQ